MDNTTSTFECSRCGTHIGQGGIGFMCARCFSFWSLGMSLVSAHNSEEDKPAP